MHITCVICGDVITGSDDTFVTNCGHLFHYNCVIQWLERSKTCPQCRGKVLEKNIHRVYFNVANIDGSDDPGSLQNKLDELKFKLRMKDIEVKTAKEGKSEMENKNKAIRMELKKAEDKVDSLNGALLCLKERMNHLKNENKKMTELQEDNKILHSRVETLMGLETIRNGSATAVDEMLNSLANKSAESRSLAAYCSVLKRELQEMEKKRKMTQTRMGEYSQNLSKAYAERDSLKEALKVSDRAQSSLNEELSNVKEELNRLQKKTKQQNAIIQNMQPTDTPNSALSILAKITSGSPSKESMATEMLRILAESPAPDELLSTLKKVSRSPNKLYPPTENETLKRIHLEESGGLTPELFLPSKRNIQSFRIPKLSDPSKEEIGLQAKASSSGSQAKAELRQPNALGGKQGYSIFQKPRLCHRPEEMLHKKPREEIYYDGMGGQRKQEIFPNPKRSMTALGAKPKLKKPASAHSSTGMPSIENYLSGSSQ
ncbi:E3 ubiquitin-protein ligase TRAIP-like [Hetaerina americana]|uniref:E3 ubiquitin-protein ligase TRAIP-like n=1 Tax=Hetaerina americana TaxID=62018 RepID=UPI003A7F1B08